MINHVYSNTMQWALYGSSLFELVTLIHRIAIFNYMPLQSYGALVSTLSLIHLAHHIADCGATNSIPPLLPYFVHSKNLFKTMILKHTIIPHLPIVIGVSVLSVAYASIMLPHSLPLHPILLATLILLESISSFLRQFLYTIQDTKAVVSIDLSLSCMRIILLWSFLFGYGIVLTPCFILSSHLICTVAGAMLKAWRVSLFYRTLPNNDNPLVIRWSYVLCTIKLPNYLLRLSRNLFTTNFLTPLFAIRFGLGTAGIFYFASKLAHFFIAVIKITIGYTGNGLLAASKAQSQEQTKKVFAMLCNKLIRISLPLVALFIISSPLIATYWYEQTACQKIVVLCALFLLLSISECFFILYECFYIIQHAASQLFGIKIAELAFLYGFIQLSAVTSPDLMLCGIICVRITTLMIIAGLAHHLWKIAPTMGRDRTRMIFALLRSSNISFSLVKRWIFRKKPSVKKICR